MTFEARRMKGRWREFLRQDSLDFYVVNDK